MMLEDKKKRILCDAIRFFGVQAQILMTVEECSELQKILLKYIRNSDKTIEVISNDTFIEKSKIIRSIAEEIADVEIMIEQLKLMEEWTKTNNPIPLDSMVMYYKDLKLEKLKEKIQEYTRVD